jgi:hypothetical protein
MDTHAARAALSSTSSGWFKSSFSGGQNGCVEFNFTVPGFAGVRDSKLGDASPVLVFKAKDLNAMLARAKAGEFDDQI